MTVAQGEVGDIETLMSADNQDRYGFAMGSPANRVGNLRDNLGLRRLDIGESKTVLEKLAYESDGGL